MSVRNAPRIIKWSTTPAEAASISPDNPGSYSTAIRTGAPLEIESIILLVSSVSGAITGKGVFTLPVSTGQMIARSSTIKILKRKTC
jgi:hypothetical protein